MNVFFAFSRSSTNGPIIDCHHLDGILPEPRFCESMIQIGASGEIEILEYNDFKEDEDDAGSVCNIPDITNSAACIYYIFHLFAYLKQEEMNCGKFFGFSARDNILFEYYLLLLERYFELLAAEQIAEGNKPIRLFNLSEDDDEEFEYIMQQAKILLNMLSIASLEFRGNPEIPPKLFRVIDLFISQYQDALFLAALANFTEYNFRYLALGSIISEESSSGSQRLFQSSIEFRLFQPYFTGERLSSAFVLLLSYCRQYSAQEFRIAILNVTAFGMQKLPNEAAKEALNDIFTGLGKQDEIFQSILEAILVIVRENLGRILESLKFPVHPDEILKRFSDYLVGDFAEQHKFFCKWAQQDYPRDKLKHFLKEKSEKFPVAGIIFARLFSKAFIERGQKLSDAFDSGICGIVQGVNEHSKLQSIECKESPEKLHKQRKNLYERLPEEVLISSGCGVKTTISAALEHLRLRRQKIHQDRQAEWRDGGVALKRWETRSDEDNLESLQQFPKYQRLTRDLNQIDALIAVLQEYPKTKLLKDVQDENKKELDEILEKIRQVEDKQRQSHLKHQRFLNEAKKSILDRLFGA
jgi:hypothetical protein